MKGILQTRKKKAKITPASQNGHNLPHEMTKISRRDDQILNVCHQTF